MESGFLTHKFAKIKSLFLYILCQLKQALSIGLETFFNPILLALD
jgi:hypothetical protein